MKKKGNWSEFHFSEVTSYKIHTLVGWAGWTDSWVGEKREDPTSVLKLTKKFHGTSGWPGKSVV